MVTDGEKEIEMVIGFLIFLTVSIRLSEIRFLRKRWIFICGRLCACPMKYIEEDQRCQNNTRRRKRQTAGEWNEVNWENIRGTTKENGFI